MMQILSYTPTDPAKRYLQRAILFALAATSIWSLLAEFYAIAAMRAFVLWIFLPATVAMIAWSIVDRLSGSRYVWRVVWIGAIAGFVASCAYDAFRVPFVFARELHIDSFVPHLPLFKVFPEFGAMILDHRGIRFMTSPGVFRVLSFLEHARAYSTGEHLIGWAYHFSNGMTFGIMYLALIGDAARRSWLWAVVLAVGLELGMLLTPYPKVFGIKITATFVAVTLSAHLIFGIALGLCARWLWLRREHVRRATR